jgi:hypothetical protein
MAGSFAFGAALAWVARSIIAEREGEKRAAHYRSVIDGACSMARRETREMLLYEVAIAIGVAHIPDKIKDLIDASDT